MASPDHGKLHLKCLFLNLHMPPPAPRHPENTALAWLGDDVQSANVLATARLHLHIQETIVRTLPPGLGIVCRVAQLKNQRLTLAVPNTAYGTKLRQMLPRLTAALSNAGWVLNDIAVKVQTSLPGPGLLGTQTKSPAPAKTAIPLDARGLEVFSKLHTQLRPGPLADAVARLLEHHRRR